MQTMLKSIISKPRKGCIIDVLKCRNHCKGGLSFGLETSQVEETSIKIILTSNTQMIEGQIETLATRNKLKLIGARKQP